MDLYYYIDILIFSPIWEEAFFRGVLLFILLKFLKPFWAITISSIVFSLFHPLYFVIIFVWGLLLAIMTYKTRSLIPAMITHSTWNLYAGKLILFF
ncbi:lysostaphin resistance A-like protein [Sporosarcina sp. ZBG7A]|uniref:CPBP family intramembrane glutamic endopeptidase n=1 Tax=Sporosarcina sp. ZBG7A TaxID=1582223 RepID=UPI00350F5108